MYYLDYRVLIKYIITYYKGNENVALSLLVFKITSKFIFINMFSGWDILLWAVLIYANLLKYHFNWNIFVEFVFLRCIAKEGICCTIVQYVQMCLSCFAWGITFVNFINHFWRLVWNQSPKMIYKAWDFSTCACCYDQLCYKWMILWFACIIISYYVYDRWVWKQLNPNATCLIIMLQNDFSNEI